MTISPANISDSILSAASSGETLVLPPGMFRACVDIPQGTRGFRLIGSGRNTTTILSDQPGRPALSIRGMWFSKIQDIGFGCLHGNPSGGVLEIDGSPSLGVQGNTFDNVMVNAQGLADGQKSRFAMTMCRQGGNGAQGSEQCFINCHFSGATRACYYQQGFNALNNQFLGGNFQNYDRCGIELVMGSLHLFGVGFQSQAGVQQIELGGWDVLASSGGAFDSLIVHGCRTESLRFLKAAWSQPPDIRSVVQQAAIQRWGAGQSCGIGDARWFSGKLYRAFASNLTGAAPGEDSWSHVPFSSVEIDRGSISNCHFEGDVRQIVDCDDHGTQVSGDYLLEPGVRHVLVDAGKNNCTITLGDPMQYPHGYEVEIIRGDHNADNKVTVWGPFINNGFHSEQLTLSRAGRAKRYRALGGGTLPRRWWAV